MDFLRQMSRNPHFSKDSPTKNPGQILAEVYFVYFIHLKNQASLQF